MSYRFPGGLGRVFKDQSASSCFLCKDQFWPESWTGQGLPSARFTSIWRAQNDENNSRPYPHRACRFAAYTRPSFVWRHLRSLISFLLLFYNRGRWVDDRRWIRSGVLYSLVICYTGCILGRMRVAFPIFPLFILLSNSPVRVSFPDRAWYRGGEPCQGTETLTGYYPST